MKRNGLVPVTVLFAWLLCTPFLGCNNHHSHFSPGGGTGPQNPPAPFTPHNPGTVHPAYGAVAGGTKVTVVLPLGFVWKAGKSEIYFLDGTGFNPAGKAGGMGFDPKQPWLVTCITPPSVTGDRLVADVVLLPEGGASGGPGWPPGGAVVLSRAYTYVDPIQDPDFGARRTYAFGPMGESVALDFDGDGDTDLAGLNLERRDLIFAVNDGAGGFTPGPVLHLPPAHPDQPAYTGLDADDVDGDGLEDLVVFGQRGYLFLRNDPHAPGTFIQTLSNDFRRGVAGCLAEMIGDLFPDLVIGGVDAVRIFLFDPAAGMFSHIQTHFDTTMVLKEISVADLDGDGDKDVVTLTNDRLVWYPAEGMLNFGPGKFLYLDPPAANAERVSLITPDLNLDGCADAVFTAADTDEVNHPYKEGVIGVALANGTGGFQSPVYTPVPGIGRGLTGALHAAALDFDGDGWTDLAVTAAGWNEVLCFRGAGSGAFALAGRYAAGSLPAYVCVLDGEGDGIADLAVMETRSEAFSYLRGLGTGIPVPLPIQPAAVARGDLDGDGLEDLVVIQETPPMAAVLLNKGAAFETPVVFPVKGGHLTALALVQADGDAFPDLAVTAASAGGGAGQLSLFLNDGTGIFSETQVLSLGAGPSGIRAGDVNNDGIPDLVVSQDKAGRATVFRGDGKGTFALLAHRPGLPGSKGVLLEDLDGDFDLDGVLPSPAHLSLYLLPTDKDGAGILQVIPEKTFLQARGAPITLTALDFDLDGRPDLAANDKDLAHLLLFRNDGFLGFIPYTPIPLRAFAAGVRAMDFDFDYMPDLCTAESGLSGVEFLRNEGGSFHSLFDDPLPVNRFPVRVDLLWMDLNGDVLPDLVVPSRTEKKVSILFNRSQ